MLHIQDLKFSYGNTALSYPNWEVKERDHAIILGSSGCGKTTLLHLIGGLMKPTSGILEIDSNDLSKKSKSALDRFRGENIGIIFQKPHLVRSLTVKENVMLSQLLGKRKTNGSAVEEILDGLGILDLKNRKVYQISQGQAQRVAIARAVINSPKLLLADEPTASLDDENCERAVEMLKKQAERTGATLILATHDQRVKKEFQNKLTL